MAKPLLDEALWAVLELLLPPDLPRPRGGRPRVPHRQVLTGILFVLRSGIPWELLPKELGCGSGMTCWRRLKGVARQRHLAAHPPRTAQLARPPRPTRLEPCRARQRPRAGQTGRAIHRPQPDRIGAKRVPSV